MHITSSWYLHTSIKRAEISDTYGLRITRSDKGTLYISGTPLGLDMQPVTDTWVLERLGKSIGELANLNGRFSGVLITKWKIYCFSDRASTQKIYFTIYNGELFAGSSALTIVEGCPRMPEMNLSAWSSFLLCKNPISNETFYQDVYTTSVGQVVEISRRNAAWETSDYDPVFGKSIIDNRPIEEFSNLLFNELSECVENAYAANRNCFAATVTGGLDSRLLIGLGLSKGIRPSLIITDNDGGLDENKMIQPLLAHWGLSTASYKLSPDYFVKYADEAIANADCLCFSHVWFMQCAKAIAQNGQAYMDGIGGSNMMRALPLSNITFMGNHLDELKEKAVSTEGLLRELIREDYYTEIDTLFVNSLRKSMQPFWGNPRGALDWSLQTRLFNNVVYFFSMFAKEMTGFSPYLSVKVLNRLLTLPQAAAQNGSLYPYLLNRLDPKLLPFPSTRDEAGKAFRMRRKIHNEKTVRWIYERLSQSPLISLGLLNSRGLDQLMEQQKVSGQYVVSYDLRALFTMDLWYREFETVRAKKKKRGICNNIHKSTHGNFSRK